MASDKLFDFVLRKEQRLNKKPPYVLRGYVVLNNPAETSGFNKTYTALSDYVVDLNEAEAFIKSMERELYDLRKKARKAFDDVARAQQKADEAAAEAAAYIARKEAEKAAEDEAEEKAAAEKAERKRRED